MKNIAGALTVMAIACVLAMNGRTADKGPERSGGKTPVTVNQFIPAGGESAARRLRGESLRALVSKPISAPAVSQRADDVGREFREPDQSTPSSCRRCLPPESGETSRSFFGFAAWVVGALEVFGRDRG